MWVRSAKNSEIRVEKGPKTGNNGILVETTLDLDSMTPDNVVFDLYKVKRAAHYIPRPHDFAYCNEPLFHPKVYVMYDPKCVMRQLGFKQEVWSQTTYNSFFHELPHCQSHDNKTVVACRPIPLPEYWRKGDNVV